MKKSWGLTQKILSGQKKIESRWYQARYAPWNRIYAGDTVYFKDAGGFITIKAEVDQVKQFADLTPAKVQEILDRYGQADGLEKDQIPKFFEMFRDKRYCLLIFLKNVQEVTPLEIDKSGFGAMAAWLVVDSIDRIRKR